MGVKLLEGKGQGDDGEEGKGQGNSGSQNSPVRWLRGKRGVTHSGSQKEFRMAGEESQDGREILSCVSCRAMHRAKKIGLYCNDIEN